MGIVVSLLQFVNEMEASADCVSVFLNRRTGEFRALSDEDMAAVENDDPAADADLPAWQQELLPKFREVVSSDDWLELPSQFDFDEYRMMQEFSSALADERLSQELLGAIRGDGAFRRFKDRVRQSGIDQDWYQFRAEALGRLAVDWLAANEIEFRE